MKLNSLVVTAGSCGPTAGSGEDLRLATEIGESGATNACAKLAMVGADCSLVVDSPNGTFIGAPTVVYFDTFTLGDAVVPALPAFPELHLSSGAQPLASTGALTAAGFAVSVMTPALAGVVLRVQAIALSTSAANGTFAISDAHDVTVY